MQQIFKTLHNCCKSCNLPSLCSQPNKKKLLCNQTQFNERDHSLAPPAPPSFHPLTPQAPPSFHSLLLFQNFGNIITNALNTLNRLLGKCVPLFSVSILKKIETRDIYHGPHLNRASRDGLTNLWDSQLAPPHF